MHALGGGLHLPDVFFRHALFDPVQWYMGTAPHHLQNSKKLLSAELKSLDVKKNKQTAFMK